jgi:hypothetical protein
MKDKEHHEELVAGVAKQMRPVLGNSPQAIYIYLDDEHKVCNKRFADLLGYKSPKEWADMEAPLSDVVEEDQPRVIEAYMNASEKMVAGSVEVKMKNVKTGRIVKTRMIIAPVSYAGHIFTIHFFSKI